MRSQWKHVLKDRPNSLTHSDLILFICCSFINNPVCMHCFNILVRLCILMTVPVHLYLLLPFEHPIEQDV